MSFNQFACIVVVIFSTQSYVVALDIDYGVSASIARHDNINQENTLHEEEWVKSLKVGMAIKEDSTNLAANVNASVESIDYRYDQQEDSNVGNLQAAMLFIIEPSLFEWHLSDVFTQTVTNPLDRNRPDNRQDVNVFSSGPNIFLRLSSKNLISLEARYQTASFEDTIADNKRDKTTIRWNHDINSSFSSALNYESLGVTFDNTSLGKITKEDLFASASYSAGRNEYQAEVGLSSVGNGKADELKEKRYRLFINNQRTSTSNFMLEARHDVSDTSMSILDSIDSPGIVYSVLNIASSDIFVSDVVKISYQKTWGINSVVINISDVTSDYRIQNNYDANSQSGYISSKWGIGSNSSITLYLQRTLTEYENIIPKRKNNDTLYGLRYSYTARRNVNINLEISSEKRESNDQNNEYEDTKMLVSIEYHSR